MKNIEGTTSLRFYRMIQEGTFFGCTFPVFRLGGSSIQHPKDYMQKMGVLELNLGLGWGRFFSRKLLAFAANKNPYFALTTFFFRE